MTASLAHAVLHCNLNVADIEAAEAWWAAAFDLTVRMRQVSPASDSRFMGLGESTSSSTVFLYDHRGPRAAPALELVQWYDPVTRPRTLADQRGVRAIGFRSARAPDDPPEGVRVETAPGDGPPSMAYLRLRVADLEATVGWYAALGWGPVSRDAAHVSLALPEDPTFTLEVDQADGAPPGMDAATQGLYRIALACEDVAAAHAELVAAGMTGLPDPFFVEMPDVPTGGFTVLFLADPDGVVVELVDRPRSSVRRPSQ